MRIAIIILGLAMLAASSASAVTAIQANGSTIQGTLTQSDNEQMPPGAPRSDASFFRDVYSFEAPASGRVEILLSCTFDGYLYLYGPDNSLVDQNDDYNGTSSARILTDLTQRGTHHLVVTSFSGGSGGDYTLTVSALPASGVAPGQPAPGPTTADVPIRFGQTITGQLTASDNAALSTIHRSDGTYFRDGYVFDASAGTQLTISASYSFDGYLILVAPDGTIYAENDDNSSTSDSMIMSTLNQSGRHRIVVTSFRPGEGGDYSLMLTQGMGTGAVSNLPVSNDSQISVGQTINGQLALSDNALLPSGPRSQPEYRRDGYWFNASSGDDVTITANFAGFDGYLFLVGPNGQMIAENDDNSSTADSMIQATLTQSGRHRIVVSSYSVGATGNYTLMLNRGLGVNTVSNGPATGDQPIQFNQTINGQLAQTDHAALPSGSRAQPQYYRDGFRFNASAGDQVTITANFTGFDGYLFLVGPSGQMLAENDDNSSTANSMIQATLTQAGTHRIVVSSFSAGSTGNYTLMLQRGIGVSTVPNVAPTGDSTIQFGQTVNGQLTASDHAVLPTGPRAQPEYYRDGYRFSGSAGNQVTITANFMNFDGYLFLVGPAGQMVAENDDNTSTADSMIMATLPQQGQYRIVVTSYGSMATGDYTLSLR